MIQGRMIMKTIITFIQGRSLAAKIFLCLVMAWSGVGVTYAGVVPLKTPVNGNTYGEWSARWVQWAYSIPAATNPLTDATGANCGVEQSGPVWFLAGTPGGAAVTRACSVPEGKSLFFPILVVTFGAGVFDCEPTIPGTPCLLNLLRKSAADSLDSVTLEVSVDGKQLKRLSDLRVQSRDLILTLPASNLIGIPAGTYSPNVADGYFVMLKPLRVGAHTIHLIGDFTAGPFAGSHIEVTYNLTIVP